MLQSGIVIVLLTSSDVRLVLRGYIQRAATSPCYVLMLCHPRGVSQQSQ